MDIQESWYCVIDGSTGELILCNWWIYRRVDIVKLMDLQESSNRKTNQHITPSISQYQLSCRSINYTISTLLYIHQLHNINSPVYPSITQYQLSYIHQFHKINSPVYPSITQYQLSCRSINYTISTLLYNRRVDIVKLMVLYVDWSSY
jgi:hypothetical protein